MIRAVVVLLLLLLPVPVAAQSGSNCGSGVPCGPIPWSLPGLPRLTSPTAMPTLVVTDSYANPGPGTPTPTPTATPTPYDIDVTAINDSVATIGAIIQQTPMAVIVDPESTAEVDLDASFTELGSNAGSFFGIARSLSGEQFGPLAPLIGFMLLAMVVTIAVKSMTFMLPVLSAVFGIVRKAISLILEFLPL